MNKRLSLFFFFCAISLLAQAQWSAKDSLNLRRMMEGDGEVNINKKILKDIDFTPFKESPMSVQEKPGLDVDATLPTVYPDKGKLQLTLMPYSARTKFNYDPIYNRKIKVDANTWKSDPFGHLNSTFIYSNWAKTPFDKGTRKSVEELEASGMRYNPLAQRANNTLVGGWEGTSAPSGNDLMAPFTKEFWDKSGRNRRARTLEVLKNYGDSTTIMLREEIKKPMIR